MTTSDPAPARARWRDGDGSGLVSDTQGRAFVWGWLPGATAPVVVGAIAATGGRLGGDAVIGFTYARSYRERPDAISLFAPELPLTEGTFDPTRPGFVTRRTARQGPGDDPATAWAGWPAPTSRSALHLAGALRDAAPDAWGRRIVNARVAGHPDTDLNELTYLLNSTSDRIGALDFQTSSTDYVPRGQEATLEELVEAAERIDAGRTLPPDLEAAADHGTSIGGARPKALLTDGDRTLVAKFASTSDDRPVVKSEAVGMLLAARLGLSVAPVEVVRASGKDVLLVERFDRTPDGGRRLMVSALTILGLREEESRYSSYADLAQSIRHAGWADPGRHLRELYTRMVLNIAISNTDDHLRNHAAFWDGDRLRLTPAYDVAPQRRSSTQATHAIAIHGEDRTSQFRIAIDAAPRFTLTRTEGRDIVGHVVDTIRRSWSEVCDEATLSRSERDQLWGREILNDYATWDVTFT